MDSKDYHQSQVKLGMFFFFFSLVTSVLKLLSIIYQISSKSKITVMSCGTGETRRAHWVKSFKAKAPVNNHKDLKARLEQLVCMGEIASGYLELTERPLRNHTQCLNNIKMKCFDIFKIKMV